MCLLVNQYYILIYQVKWQFKEIAQQVKWLFQK